MAEKESLEMNLGKFQEEVKSARMVCVHGAHILQLSMQKDGKEMSEEEKQGMVQQSAILIAAEVALARLVEAVTQGVLMAASNANA